METAERKRRGAWYTPQELVAEVCRQAFAALPVGVVVRVLDPACGDGRFLATAAQMIDATGAVPHLMGVDIDRAAVEASRAALAEWDAEVVEGDALGLDWPAGTFDAVIGNPPFLSQMSSPTSRHGRSRWGGGPYADAAVEFLALARHAVRSDGGRIALVLPQSILASRDAADVRRSVQSAASLRWLWWSTSSMFDAGVRPCALVAEMGTDARPVALCAGPQFSPLGAVPPPRDGAEWSRLLAVGIGVPELSHAILTDGTVGARARAHLDFRDEYYGLVAAVSDTATGPPLVTSGLIDPGRCRWGERRVRFARTEFDAPRVALGRLDARMRGWAAERLVPKVLVASQTRIIEAVADPHGAWLPGIPVVSLVPGRTECVSAIAAVLTSPVASAWIAVRAAGNGLSTKAIRPTPSLLEAVPWPAGDVEPALCALANGDISGCGRAITDAFGVGGQQAAELLSWWRSSAGC